MAEAGKEARRALKIKVGSVTRLHKEIKMYEAEVLAEAEKTEKLRASGACPHDVRQQARTLLCALRCRAAAHSRSPPKQENVQAESAMMIPDCRLRLENALADLETALVRWLLACY